jgi:hypothetical protein
MAIVRSEHHLDQTRPISPSGAMPANRFNRFVSNLSQEVLKWLQSPWQRSILMVIGLLGGFYLGNMIPPLIGHTPKVGIVVVPVLVLVIEGISRLVYGSGSKARTPLIADMINAIKIGVMYSLFVDAVKLGS